MAYAMDGHERVRTSANTVEPSEGLYIREINDL